MKCLDTKKHGDIHGPTKLDTGCVPGQLRAGSIPFINKPSQGQFPGLAGKIGTRVAETAGFVFFVVILSSRTATTSLPFQFSPGSCLVRESDEYNN